LRIDGTVKTTQRQELIDQFNEDDSYDCFLLSSQTGSLGITLTAADRIILIDPWWNPSRDNQAVDRIYRIGQKKNVVIYRLVCCGTVEEKIYRQQIFKQGLSRATVATGEASTKKEISKKDDQYRYFTSQQLTAMFKLQDDETKHSATQKQLEEIHKDQRKTYPELDQQIQTLSEERFKKLLFGLSDHDLLFQAESEDDLLSVQLPQDEQDYSSKTNHIVPQPVDPSYKGVIPVQVVGKKENVPAYVLHRQKMLAQTKQPRKSVVLEQATRHMPVQYRAQPYPTPEFVQPMYGATYQQFNPYQPVPMIRQMNQPLPSMPVQWSAPLHQHAQMPQPVAPVQWGFHQLHNQARPQQQPVQITQHVNPPNIGANLSMQSMMSSWKMTKLDSNQQKQMSKYFDKNPIVL
jgi:hypothetical protein